MPERYPNVFCVSCKRYVQRRDNAPNCFWCKTPFGSEPFPELQPDGSIREIAERVLQGQWTTLDLEYLANYVLEQEEQR